ncbi:type II toxin-antitoxin system RelB/DinJ family antitoxin [Anaerotignum sp.]|uniref:type II toxin-antitoxin system RelB/DinJ family antitoxin n=1 Tax=Anaerotignum sp. TaxID=2039241 RepID=UPI0028AD4C2F|nr:type II toxin-antitoxin system RelB/DinJ family antitoxin [Anaerotignum sp.]
MANANITIRMDEDLKKQAEQLFNDLGMNITTAFTIFTKTAVREQRIPFEIALNTPNTETIEALKEADRISGDANTKMYSSFTEVLGEISADV